MKPKDLPYTIKSFASSIPSYIDGVLSIPAYFHADKDELFPSINETLKEAKALHVEICSGNGEWITEKASNNPEIFYIAIEKKFMRVRKIWSKMKNMGIKNLLIVCGMGEDFFQYYLEKGSIDQIFINFPDPWPKTRHAKHRIIKSSFIKPLYDMLKNEGTVTITTDCADYSAEIIDLFKQDPHFENLYKEKGYIPLDEGYGGSYFKRLWKDLGRVNRLMTFKKIGL